MLSFASRTGQDQIPLYNPSLFKYINTTYQKVSQTCLTNEKRKIRNEIKIQIIIMKLFKNLHNS